MITGWLTAEGWLRLMNTTDWKKKITRENFFWTLKFFLLLKLSSQLCLMKIVEALFIGEDSDLKFYWIFNLEKFWNLSRVEIAGAMKSAEGEYFFFSLLETWKEKISFYFPILHVACKVVESRQILLFTTIHDFWCGFIYLFIYFFKRIFSLFKSLTKKRKNIWLKGMKSSSLCKTNPSPFFNLKNIHFWTKMSSFFFLQK